MKRYILDSLADLESYAKTLPRLLRESVRFVLDEPRFVTAPASSDTPNSGHKHHTYPGGLVVHTLEVLQMAFTMKRKSHASFELKPILITAAIWHDFAKVYEYKFQTELITDALVLTPAGSIIKTPYKNHIAHVAGSYAEFMNAARATNLAQEDPDSTERIGHCILAHHGRKEWGSPVEPQTEEAYILHAADMWSARFGPGKDTPCYSS